MKKKFLSVCAITLASSFLFSSCIGSFGLTNKVLSWNQQISNKFANEVVFFGLWVLPVYEVSLIADLFVLNSVEFWSGTNPVMAGKKVINGENGRYLVEWNKEGYTITNEASHEAIELKFDDDTRTWSVATENGDIPFLTYIDDTHVKVPAGQGDYKIVELSQAGVLAYEDHVTSLNRSLAMR